MTYTTSLNPEMIRALATAFPRLSAPATSWGNVISNHLLLRHLRGYWPFTSVDENGDVYDLSGQGRVLTNNNAVPFASAGLMTYADFTPGSNHYFSRADEAGLSITGALTVGGWFWLDTLASGADQGLIGKYDTAGNDRSYQLRFLDATNLFIFVVSVDGTATTIVTFPTSPVINTWYHVVGRYTPSTTIDIYVNGVKATNAVAIPAALDDNVSAFEIGAMSAGGARLDGRASHCFLCADDLEDYFIKALFWHSCPLVGVKP